MQTASRFQRFISTKVNLDFPINWLSNLNLLLQNFLLGSVFWLEQQFSDGRCIICQKKENDETVVWTSPNMNVRNRGFFSHLGICLF